jgi:hypothetical protein
MRRLEDFMNKLTDADWGWWPFLRLRPPPHVEMDDFLLLRLAIFGGCFLGLVLFYPLSRILNLPASLFSALLGVLLCSIFFFVGYKFSFAYFWNRRARRLQRAAGDGSPK